MRAVKLNKKTTAFISAGLLTVATAGGAYAYWTINGTGTGTATTGTTMDLTVVQVAPITDLKPLGPPQTIVGMVTNNGTAPQWVNSVTVSITSVTPDHDGTCSATDYTLTNPLMNFSAELAAGGQGAFGGATIEFKNDPDVNQDGCKGATVNLLYTVG